MKLWIRNPFAFGVMVAALSLGACGDDEGPIEPPPGEPPPSEVIVEMQDNVFDQQEVTVAVGGKVTWVNAGENRHTSTSDDGIWDSELLDPGEDFEWTFDEAGTFPYHCIPHQPNMEGTVIVEEVE